MPVNSEAAPPIFVVRHSVVISGSNPCCPPPCYTPGHGSSQRIRQNHPLWRARRGVWPAGIAVPVTQVRATATITAGQPGSGLTAGPAGHRPAAGRSPAGHLSPLAHVAQLSSRPAWPGARARLADHLAVHHPVASGLGSGAAAATAIVRALAAAAGRQLAPAQVSALVYESETLFHGRPSGVDNTVIAYEQPVWFVRGQPPQPFRIAQAFTIVIGDTGIASPTRLTVGDVRAGWQAEPARFEALFDGIASIVLSARRAIEDGDVAELGPLMDANHRLLQALGVSVAGAGCTLPGRARRRRGRRQAQRRRPRGQHDRPGAGRACGDDRQRAAGGGRGAN